MAPAFFKGVVLGGATAVLTLAATAALAGTGIGGVFNLGQPNTVNQTTGLSGSVAAAQLKVTNSNSGGSAVYGRHGATSGDQPGLYGETAATSANATGVFGFVPSTVSAADSSGVKGLNYGAGRGVTGQSSSGYGVYGDGKFGLVGFGRDSGVWASTSNSSGSGIYGQNTNSGKGVFGKSTNGPGVYGESSLSFGVSARSTKGTAIYGEGIDGGVFYGANTGTGVRGTVFGSGTGVLGSAEAGGIGVHGVAHGSGGVAVEGDALSGAYAALFQGNVDVQGYLELAFRVGAPPASDCVYSSHRGRTVVVTDSGNTVVWLAVCGPGGWRYVQLSEPPS